MSIEQFLLIQRFYSEVKNPGHVNSNETFAKLLKLMVVNNYALKPTLATLSYLIHQTKGVFDLETPAFSHIRNILFA